MNKEQLQEWVTPKLTVYGSVTEITKSGGDKTLGSNDGIFLLGIGPIGDVLS